MATKWIPDTPVTQKVTPNFEKAINTNETFSAASEPQSLEPAKKKSKGLEEKYKPVYQAWAAKPDKANTAALLKAISPEIDRGILATVGQSNPLVKSRARLIAVNALKRYNPEESALSTHVINNLQSLRRVNRQQTQIISVPERVFYDQSYLKQAETEFEMEHGRAPTDSELADNTGLSMRRIAHIRKFHPGVSEGSMVHDDEDSEFSSAPAVLGRRNVTPFLNVVYDDVDKVDKKIMEWSFGMNGQPKLPGHVIAAKLRITPGAVSQRKAKIQNMLNQISEFT